MKLKTLLRTMVVWILTTEAKLILGKYRPKVIIVTGSVGKTSAKDAVYAALSSSFFVRKSEKSFNSDIGVPLTIIGAPSGWGNPMRWARNIFDGLSLILSTAPYPEFLVLEVGADRPGDIARTLSWLTPSAVVATRFPDVPVHVEFYSSPEAVFAEESAPARWLSESGVLVVNADDSRAATLAARGKRVSFGFSKEASVHASRFHTSSKNKMPTGISFDVSYGGETAHAAIPHVVGKAHAYAVLAGIASAVSLGVPLEKAVEASAEYQPPAGRCRLISGVQGSVFIDDSYNASPAATEEALHTLQDIPRKARRIAVLGDMLELGAFSVSEHERMGAIAASSCDVLITVGVRARGIGKSAQASGMPEDMVHESENALTASAYLAPFVGEGDVVLVKGSQGMRMEHIVKSLMAKPEESSSLLVRQEPEWRRR